MSEFGGRVRRIHRYIFITAAAPSILFMLLLGGIAFYELFRSIAVFWSVVPPEPINASPKVAAIGIALRGVEMLFLAPLPFLVIYSLSRFLQSQIDQDHHGSRSVSRVKILISGLLIALIGTHLTSSVIRNETIALAEAAAAAIIVLVLVAYVWTLESHLKED